MPHMWNGQQESQSHHSNKKNIKVQKEHDAKIADCAYQARIGHKDVNIYYK